MSLHVLTYKFGHTNPVYKLLDGTVRLYYISSDFEGEKEG